MELTSVDFDKQGFAVFKKVLSIEEIQILRDETAKLINKPIDPRQGDNKNVKSNILMRSDVIAKMFLQDKVMKVVKEICGENFYILPKISVMKSQYGRWHKDTTSIELFNQNFHKKEDFRVVNVAIYFQDNGEFGGGLDVVPGSHKLDDKYVEYYKAQEETPNMQSAGAKKRGFIKQVFLVFKSNLKKSLLNIGLLPIKYVKNLKNELISYELDSTDHTENKYTIPSEVGDVVIFDLRLDHKASWPKKDFLPESIPTKYAFFAICGANNQPTIDYHNYLLNRAETQEAYRYLQNYKLSPQLQDLASQKKFSII